jgi:hypothetical protein
LAEVKKSQIRTRLVVSGGSEDSISNIDAHNKAILAMNYVRTQIERCKKKHWVISSKDILLEISLGI